MAKAKKVKETSGVDLSALTFEQIQLLKAEIETIDVANQEKEKLARIDALKTTGKLKELKAEYKELKKEMAKTEKTTVTFEVVVPLKFTMNVINQTELMYVLEDESLYEVQLEASIAKGSTLTKAQKEFLEPQISNLVEDACEDILILVPDEIMSRYHGLDKKAHAFMQKLTENNLTLAREFQTEGLVDEEFAYQAKLD